MKTMAATRIPAVLPDLTPREAITDTIHRIITAWDRQDEALLRSAMAKNAVFILGEYKQNGIEEIIEKNFAHVSSMGTTHSLSALRIHIIGETAQATCTAVSMHVPTGTGMQPEHKHFQVGSLYDMHLERAHDGQWLLNEWKLTPVWANGDQSIMSA